MATPPTSIVNSVIQNMLAATQSKQNQQTLGQNQQRLDLAKQQEQRAAQQQFDEEVQHGLDNGGRYIGPGNQVQETQYGPDGQPTTIMRPVNPNRYVAKYKNPGGGPDVHLEMLTDDEQKLNAAINKARGLGPAEAQNTQRTAQAQATGTAAGVTAGKQADLAARGVPLSQDDVTRFGMPDSAVGMRMLPEQIDQLSGRIAPATIRGKTAKEIADDKNAAAQARTDAITQRDKDLQDAKAQAAALLADHKLNMQDAWQKARTSISANTSTNLNNRVLLQQFDGQQKLHGLLTDQAYKETQRQLEAQALLDPKAGTQDGEEFTNPFTGKKGTMNGAMRIVLQSALGASQAQVANLSARAQAIEQRYGLSGQPNEGGGQGTGGGTPTASRAVPPGATPAAQKPAAQGSGPAVAAAARANQQPAGAVGSPASSKYKVGETKSYNGGTYKFDGKQWVLQRSQAGVQPR